MNVADLFLRFENLNVLVVGDVMLDRYLTGRVGRISPEAPVPVVEWEGEENRLGGAANVALNLKALGATPFLCGVVGKDLESREIFDLLAEASLEETGIVISKERPTTFKTRVIAGHQHLLRLDREISNDLTEPEAEAFLKRVKNLLESKWFAVLILQDYNKGVLSKKVIRWLLAEAKRHRMPVAVDPKNRNFWEYREAALFKPNLKEVRDVLHVPVFPEKTSLRHASRLLQEKLANQLTLITLSEKGLWLDDGEKGELFSTQPRNVADVCGAGDTVISIAALAVALGLDLEEIALLANLAGGQVVEKVGVVPVDREQLKQELLLALTKI